MSQRGKTRVELSLAAAPEHEVPLRLGGVDRGIAGSFSTRSCPRDNARRPWLGSRNAMAMLPPVKLFRAVLTRGEPMAIPPEPRQNGAVDVLPIVHGTYEEGND